MQKIVITDEMIELALAEYVNGDGDGVSLPLAMNRALMKVAELIGRDYVLSAIEPPAEMHRVTDRSGDDWYRLADGRWICVGEGTFRDSAREIANDYGPLSW